MANNFDSNITRPLAKSFTKAFDSNRIASKNVNTQLLDGKFNPSTGENVDFKRPTDYVAHETSTGDISSITNRDIITGKATGTVQDYITVVVDYNEADEALKMDQLDQLLEPMARRAVTTLELNFAAYAAKNAGLYAGTIGNGVETWEELANASAMMKAVGVPMDAPWNFMMNPFTERKLASNQRSLGAGGVAGELIKTAHEKALIASNVAGLDVYCGTTLPTITTGTGADRTGAINGTPVVTYVGAKDTMTQSIPVDGFQANLAIAAGERVQVASTNLLNMSTRQAIIDEAGGNILWTGTVTEAVTLDGSGAGTLTVTGPAIYEASGAFNTVTRALADNDVISLLGAADTTYQPNLFWHRDAFGIGFVPIKKLYSTDTLAKTKDGVQIRVSKYSDGDANSQTVRFDIRPAFATFNPYHAGHGWGDA